MFGSQGRRDVRTRPVLCYEEQPEHTVEELDDGGRLKGGGQRKGKGSALRAGQQDSTNDFPNVSSTDQSGNSPITDPLSNTNPSLLSSISQIRNSQQFLDGLRSLQIMTQNLIAAYDQVASKEYEATGHSKRSHDVNNSQHEPSGRFGGAPSDIPNIEDTQFHKRFGLPPPIRRPVPEEFLVGLNDAQTSPHNLQSLFNTTGNMSITHGGNNQGYGNSMSVGPDGKFKIYIPLFLKLKVGRDGNVEEIIRLQFAEKVELTRPRTLPYQ